MRVHYLWPLIAGSIGKRIAELRIEMNLSTDKLADRIGFSEWTVRQWERGRNQPTISAVILLSDVFGVSTDYLLKGGTHKCEKTINSGESAETAERVNPVLHLPNIKQSPNSDVQ